MADSKITALTAISTVDPTADPLVIVDVSDTSMAASGTTKKGTINQLLGAGGTATLASATITGDLTVDTNVLKVDSANNRVGIGTASPTVPLYVTGNNATATAIMQDETNGAKLRLLANSINFDISNGGGGGDIAVSGANPFTFRTNGSERYRIASDGIATWSNVGGVAGTAMTLNATGLGIGVTPSAWGTYKGLQVGYASLAGYAGSDTLLGSNVYFDGGAFRYISTATALNYRQLSGVHQWNIAPSGTAGNAITFTQAMTLDASGNLFVGKTATGLGTVGIQASPSGWFQATVSGDASLFTNRLASDGKTIQLYRQTLEVGNISVTTTGATFNSTSDYRLKEAVAPLSGGLARVNALKPSVYKWKSNGLSGEGFLAHELAEVVPAAVNGEKDDVNEDGSIKAQSIDMSRVVPILVAAIKELTAEVNALKNA